MAEGSPPLTLHEAAVRHGAYRWIELRLFELTGAWSAAPGVPNAARVHLFEASAQHAWHAELWADRLPVLAGVDHDALTRPLGPVLVPLFDALGAAPQGGAAAPDAAAAGDAGDAAALAFLAGLSRVVLPALLDSYRRHREALSEVADGPSLRALALVVRDEEAEVAEAGAVLEAITPGATATGDVDALARLLEGTDGPGPAGDLVPWPEDAATGPAPGAP